MESQQRTATASELLEMRSIAVFFALPEGWRCVETQQLRYFIEPQRGDILGQPLLYLLNEQHGQDGYAMVVEPGQEHLGLEGRVTYSVPDYETTETGITKSLPNGAVLRLVVSRPH